MPNPTADEIGTATGKGVRILLLDSGVELEHPSLKGASIRCFRLEDTRMVEDPGGGDPFGHGTAVASIVHYHAPEAQLDCLKIFDFGQRGLGARTRIALLGMWWGIELGYDVVNCSFVTEQRERLEEFKELVDRAFRKRVILVASSDNEQADVARYPADFPTVLGTTHGPLEGLRIRRRPGCRIELEARGEMVPVAWRAGRYRLATGSSYAAPHVSALAARVRQLRPQWNACQVKSMLYELAEGGG